MAWGFCVGNGWYKLVKGLLSDLEQISRYYPEDFIGFRVEQVKEKFGGLRFYVNRYPNCGMPNSIPTEEFFNSNKIFQIIDKAERLSFTICEDCGKDGKLREDRSWIRTLCDSCSTKDLKHS